jgi:hypothetical protein
MGSRFFKGAFGILRAVGFLGFLGFLSQAEALAQRGPASASAAHIGGAVHAGPSPSFSGSSRRFSPPPASLFTSPSGRSPSFRARNPQPLPGQTRHPGNGMGGVGYRRHYPYIYGSYAGLVPFGYGLPLPYALPYGNDQDDANGPQPAPQQADYGNQPMSDYGPEPPQLAANTPPLFRPGYQPQGETVAVNAQPTTTLIFKDGRRPMQVHNYALTAGTLYALDGESRQEIPLSLLDVPATVAANRAAGVDFALPVSR